MSFQINAVYSSEAFRNRFRTKYKRKQTFIEAGAELITNPFLCAKFADFVELSGPTKSLCTTSDVLNYVKDTIEHLSFTKKQSDLFSFSQSQDISNVAHVDKSDAKLGVLSSFRSFLLTSVLPWLCELTDAPLELDKVDLTASKYEKGDYLLCHDDELEGRRIAFVWYLVPVEWNPLVDGGELQLFNTLCEDNNAPIPISQSLCIPPLNNSLVFFEVSSLSYHQVCEVIGNRTRLSLHGWFRGPSLSDPNLKDYYLTPPERISPIHVEEELVYKWINPAYLDTSDQNKIRRRFCGSSEIQLTNFLNVNNFFPPPPDSSSYFVSHMSEQLGEWQQLVSDLSVYDESYWLHRGPYNRRNFHALSQLHHASNLCAEIQRLFKSEAMLVILSDLTGIKLHPVAHMGNAQCNYESKRARLDEDHLPSDNPSELLARISEPELRRFQTGCYTLLTDADVSNKDWRLDSVLHIQALESEKSEVHHSNECDLGGELVYIAEDTKDALLTITPVNNSLTLVYIGPGTTSFVKYINHSRVFDLPDNANKLIKRENVALYDLAVTFYDPDSNSNDDDSDTNTTDTTSEGDSHCEQLDNEHCGADHDTSDICSH